MFETEDERIKFRKLYEKYKNFMYKIAYNTIYDEHEAEDIVHITFLKISSFLDKVDMANEKKTKVFLGTITKNTAIDCYRRKKKLGEVEELPEAIDKHINVERDLIDKYNYQCLIREIEVLPDKYKDVMRLRFVYELSIQETASALSISENNAYARISRAKKMLWEALEKGETVNEA